MLFLGSVLYRSLLGITFSAICCIGSAQTNDSVPKENGFVTEYYPDGKVKSHIYFQNGNPNGLAQVFGENGDLSESGYWTGKYWIANYTLYYPNGQKRHQFLYDTLGRRFGLQLYFHPNGLIAWCFFAKYGDQNIVNYAFDSLGNFQQKTKVLRDSTGAEKTDSEGFPILEVVTSPLPTDSMFIYYVLNENANTIRLQRLMNIENEVSQKTEELQTAQKKLRVFYALLVFIVLVLLIILIHSRSRIFPVLGKWFPLFLWGLSASGGFFTVLIKSPFTEWIYFHIDVKLLVLLLVSAIPTLLLIGLLRPRLLRQIARVAPFNIYAGFIVSLARFRRKYYEGYIQYVRKSVIQEEGDEFANSTDRYVVVPAYVRSDQENDIIVQPLDFLFRKLQASFFQAESAAHVAIISPGGLGKSALLRALALKTINHFDQYPSAPLPIFINVSGSSVSTIDGLIRNQLGKYVFSEQMFQHELQSGRFIVFIDGLSEAEIVSAEFHGFFAYTHEAGSNTNVILTMRRDSTIERRMSRSSNFIYVEPQLLDETSVKQFITAYIGEEELSAQMLNVCRTQQGSYLPILIRLAILAKKFSVNNITELYDKTIRVLLKEDVQPDNFRRLLPEIYTLALESYYQQGMREVRLTEGNRKTITMLVDSGLLIPSSQGSIVFSEAKRYRFFHDSIQTYLAVAAIFSECDNSENQKEVLKAFFNSLPQHERLLTDHVNFIFDGSEILQMALLYLTARNIMVEDVLEDKIQSLAIDHARCLSIQNVWDSLPSQCKAMLDITSFQVPLDLFHEGLKHCQDNLFALGELYCNLVEILKEEKAS